MIPIQTDNGILLLGRIPYIHHDTVMAALQLLGDLKDPVSLALANRILGLVPVLLGDPVRAEDLPLLDLERLLVGSQGVPPLILQVCLPDRREDPGIPLVPSSGFGAVDVVESLHGSGLSLTEAFDLVSRWPLNYLDGWIQRKNNRDPKLMQARKEAQNRTDVSRIVQDHAGEIGEFFGDEISEWMLG